MTEEVKECPEWEEFSKWFEETVMPKYKEFFKHAATCPACQQKLFKGKEQMLMGLLKISDEELSDEMKRMSEG